MLTAQYCISVYDHTNLQQLLEQLQQQQQHAAAAAATSARDDAQKLKWRQERAAMQAIFERKILTLVNNVGTSAHALVIAQQQQQQQQNTPIEAASLTRDVLQLQRIIANCIQALGNAARDDVDSSSDT
jgi:short-subunit dehydrogenase